MVAFRKYIEILLTSISGEARKELEIDHNTIAALRNVSKVLRFCCGAIMTKFADQLKVSKGSIDLVLNKMKKTSKIKILTYAAYIEKKKPDRLAMMKKEIDKNKSNKNYPSNRVPENTYLQYTVDTFVYESLFFTLRDLFLDP